ncbi:hypothetical protein [Desulfovibrio sp. TomC]|uniref:hypothetical protein n=1 Tax=Desulfovibrio sp. TomC TaxID=1562888 RepID=UPI0012E21CB1|nr:hypothetical protein [Desulfovibrio sp. TomC]
MDTDKKLPKIRQSGVIQIRGKDVTAYESKLDYAHQIGIRSLEVDVLQYQSEQNGQVCLCKARLETDDGKVFSDIADASPHNVPRGCTDSFPRIASTRAKSRVISDAFNVKSVVSDDADPLAYEGAGGHIIDVDFSAVEPVQGQALQAAHDGGGTKPASDRQLHLIGSLASQRHVSPEDMAASMFGKSLNHLQGSEASQLIKQLK